VPSAEGASPSKILVKAEAKKEALLPAFVFPELSVVSDFMAGAERYHPTETIAKFLLLTPRRVRQLTAEGVFTRARDSETGEFLRGRYSLFETTHAYIKFLREGKLDDPDGSNYIRSRSRRMHSLAEEATIRVQILKGKVHRSEDVEFFMSNRDTAIRARILAISSRITRMLVGKTDPAEIRTSSTRKRLPF